VSNVKIDKILEQTIGPGRWGLIKAMSHLSDAEYLLDPNDPTNHRSMAVRQIEAAKLEIVEILRKYDKALSQKPA